MEDSNGEGKSQDGFMATPTKDQNPDIYENRRPKKIIRVVTVMAYLFSVSFVGILLSAYYIFLWEPPNPRLMQRQRLRTDPQMQFLIAQPSDETDSTKKDGSFLQQSEVNHVHKPLLLGRMSQDIYDDDDSVVDPRDKMDLEKKRRLNMILLNLRHSLVDTLRAQNRSLSRETAISNRLNNSFVKVGKVLNSTMGRAENSISRNDESRRGNTSEKETYNGNADLPSEFANSTSTLDVESTSSTLKFTTIPGTETNQTHFDRDPVTNATPITEEKNHKKKLDELYLVRGFDNVTANSDVTNGSNQRVFGDNNSFKMTKEFRKIDRKEPRQNKTDDRRWNNDEENDLGDVQTSVILEDRVNGSIRDPHQKNYSNDSKSSSKDQIGQITRDTVSIDPSSRNLGFTDDPGFHQTPDDPTVIKSQPRTTGTRNSEETQIERMIARSTTIDNKQLEQIDLSTTQRQKSSSEIFTEVADVEETSVELTSISTTRDYHNFTSITSEDDENVT
ncbi:uncharacterized protein LOC112460788 [Temnothorax curvispinosus]|uniref:Uncharacterized protein LOC112460788 n=1 Tax=Temnothorax curvispinosus TaxID=300111 RepID=A0A6J1QJX1_9HYME|nr:uncharacterized protein LOC112460788 [Temnothorax curvispinosus]